MMKLFVLAILAVAAVAAKHTVMDVSNHIVKRDMTNQPECNGFGTCSLEGGWISWGDFFAPYQQTTVRRLIFDASSNMVKDFKPDGFEGMVVHMFSHRDDVGTRLCSVLSVYGVYDYGRQVGDSPEGEQSRHDQCRLNLRFPREGLCDETQGNTAFCQELTAGLRCDDLRDYNNHEDDIISWGDNCETFFFQNRIWYPENIYNKGIKVDGFVVDTAAWNAANRTNAVDTA
mmetsp:Transcript_12086/g.34045  ORF Transcript_12086/g.34045 Transcript_12086/m.34045 type:complete len:230 (+) Transcript_12086:66-755(+)